MSRQNSRVRVDWPLVGRGDALTRLQELLTRRDLSAAVIAGPAGVGKTRLAAEACRLAETSGIVSVRVVASRAAARMPLGALAPLLPPIDSPPGVDLLHQASAALRERAGDEWLLLVVDDAHNLDDASAVLLQQLALEQTIFVVATVRSGEPVPDAVLALWKDDLTEAIELMPLDDALMSELLTRVLGGPIEGVALRQLWEASQGNVQYLRELVLGGIEADTLVDDGGLWRIVGTIPPSRRLSELVADRLGDVSDGARTALELVAFGEPIGVDVLERLTSRDVVHDLERRGLLAVGTDDRRLEARLAHPIHGDVVRDETPDARARQVYGLLADELERDGASRRGDTLRLVLWRLDAGGTPDAGLLAKAAFHALFANDLNVAGRLAEAAYRQQPSFETGHVLADCLYSLGRSEDVEALLAELEPLTTDDEQLGMLAMARAHNLFWHLGHEEEADAEVRRIIDRLESETVIDELAAMRALFAGVSGHPVDALDAALPLLERGTGRTIVRAGLAASLSLPAVGRGEEAVTVSRRAQAEYDRLGEQLGLFEPSLVRVGEVLAVAQLGRLDEAEQLARQGYDRALRENDGAGWAFHCQALGVINLERGRLAEAARWWLEAGGLFEAVNHPGPARWARIGIIFTPRAAGGDRRGSGPGHRDRGRRSPGPAAGGELPACSGMAGVGGPRPRRCPGMLPAGSDVGVGAGSERQRAGGVARPRPARRPGGGRAARPDAGRRSAGRPRRRPGRPRGGAARPGPRRARSRPRRRSSGAARSSWRPRRRQARPTATRTAGDARSAKSWRSRAAGWAAECDAVRTPGMVVVDSPTPLTRRERGGGAAGGRRHVQPRDRRAPLRVGAHGRQPPRPGLRQAGNHRSGRAGRPVDRPQRLTPAQLAALIPG